MFQIKPIKLGINSINKNFPDWLSSLVPVSLILFSHCILKSIISKFHPSIQQSLLLILKKNLLITPILRQTWATSSLHYHQCLLPNQHPENWKKFHTKSPRLFKWNAAVCLTDRLIFKKMHHSWSPETGHYVCFGCFRAWKRACSRKSIRVARMRPAYLSSMRHSRMLLQGMSVYVACSRMQSPLRHGVPGLRGQWPRGRKSSRLRSLLALHHRGPRMPHLRIGRPSSRGR